jgi:ketosteroid isomerase-like protein
MLPQSRKAARMMRPALQALITRVHDLWSTGRLDQIDQILSPDFICHLPPGWQLPDLNGPQQMGAAILEHRAAFADWSETIEDMIIEGDKAVTRFSATGTHTGVFQGLAPTLRPVKVDEIAIFLVRNGLVTRQWFLSDDLALDHQLRD